MTEREKRLAETFFNYKDSIPNGTGFILMEVAFINGESGSVHYKFSDKPTFIEQPVETKSEESEQKSEE
jgi:hypothetical protein